MDKKILTVAVFLDVSKAFDSVNHEKLILKLQDIRVSSSTLQWFVAILGTGDKWCALTQHYLSLFP